VTRLPAINARQLIKALIQAGFLMQRQKGSHVRLHHPLRNFQTTVPVHPGDIPKSLVKQILKQCDLSEDDFLKFI
jgi:predicted RNA binding protein YcfA (HicA-like mRNA interferase family)